MRATIAITILYLSAGIKCGKNAPNCLFEKKIEHEVEKKK